MAEQHPSIPTQLLSTYTWPNGERLRVIVTLQSGYPDALAEGAATVRRMMREMVADLIAIDDVRSADPDE